MIQTLIVDDENIERQGIKRLINSYALPFQVTLGWHLPEKWHWILYAATQLI